eukprot:TRINITY_DN12052_c0_g1_i1.p2 TRINITY_DN12052_c0_g1~~TRINITY_DN12052_c0_g1_i1.p2  ORF type:complete len:246 (+),score=45.98 TRINITY_DN12052_c0_g1_i1:1338-2075(+)
MWFSGLRGAIAFALASYGTHQGVLKHGDRLVTTTWATVIATVFIFGGLSKTMLRILGLDPGSNGGNTDSEPLIPVSPSHAASTDVLDETEEVVVVGATHGPPPEIPEDESLHSKVWRNIRTCMWQSASWCLAADTRWIKPFVCLQVNHVDRQREKVCLKLLREGADYTATLSSLRRTSSRSHQSGRARSIPRSDSVPAADPPATVPETATVMTAVDPSVHQSDEPEQNDAMISNPPPDTTDTAVN